MTTNTYRKKPVVIEAVQYTEEVRDAHLFDGHPLPEGAEIPRKYLHPGDRRVYSADAYIQTLEGRMSVSIGDWIIKGVKGEFYPCKPDIFAATYEPALASAPAQPVAWMFQHDETGRCCFCANDGVNTIQSFVEANPRMLYVCALYPAAPALTAKAQAAPEGSRQITYPITEEMHMAACKVLCRAIGLHGTPQRMLDAMLAAAPQPPAHSEQRKPLPEWEDCSEAVDAGTASELERFIYDNEPADDEGTRAFRDGLEKVLDEAAHGIKGE